MKWFRTVVERIFPGTRTARMALEDSQAGNDHVDKIVADLHRIQRENHFSQALTRTLEGR